MRKLKIPRFLKENGLIIFILLLAAFLRFYQIEDRASFLGEQGRDLLVAKDILSLGKLTLLGPSTSLSPNIHFGPFYHYFNAFWLGIFKLNPLGPAVGFGVLSLLACFFLYSTAKNFGFKKVGLLASLLFAISPLMIRYGQSMFNSYFLVSLTTFSLWGISKFWMKKQRPWLLWTGVFSGLTIQANFLAYGLFFSVLFLFVIWRKNWLKNIFWFGGGLFLGILPYLAFEARHAFFNTRGFIDWLAQSGKDGFSQNFWLSLPQAFFKSFYYSLGNQNNFLTLILLALSMLFFIFFLRQKKKDDLFKIIWLFYFSGIFFIRVYSGELLDHYLGVVYPFLFLWFGYLFSKFISFNNKKGLIFFIGFLLFLGIQLSQFRFKSPNGWGMPSGWNMKATKESAKIIAKDASGSFNIANLLDGDTRGYAYRYFLALSDKKPLGVEEYPQSEILYVLTRVDKEKVLNYPVWEIYSLGKTKIEKTWLVKDDIKIFKLIKE
jgi:4-amino-4-deoxy-L-arabinose transferase-like glycosyltransferase